LTDSDFRYDVALSFLADDEPLAREIEKLLPNLKTFVYSERQLEIAATDGAETFSDVFGRDGRIVVVLYREKWGTTKWTRIEETAIKNRVLNDGADFLTFIHLEPGKPTPRWLPQTRLWVDFQRLGLVGAVSVIEERIRQAGGAVREETAEENAARLERELEANVRRLAFLKSDDGVRAADESAGALFSEMERIAEKASLSCARAQDGAALYRDGFTVEIYWTRQWRNTLDDSRLYVIEWEGRPDFGGQRYHRSKSPTELKRHELDFDAEQDERVWRDRKTGHVFSNERVAEGAVKMLLERVRKNALKRH
jgi:hypothetical protein